MPITDAEFPQPEQLDAITQRCAVRLARLRSDAALIGARFADHRQRVLDDAAEAMAGRLRLPGTGGKRQFVGDPPHWHDNPVNDFEYVWTLNRMFHWPTLLWAWLFTGERRYADKVADEWTDWIEQCPRPPLEPRRDFYDNTDPWRSLEVGIRMWGSWPMALTCLAGGGLIDHTVLARCVRSFDEHCQVLAEVCPVFWPNADHNHYLMENLGLLAAVELLPQSPSAARWTDHALRELERCAAAQITEDGGQIEGCPHYHNGCVYWFARAALHARQLGRPLSSDYMQRLNGMLAYTVHAMRPCGSAVPWGDSDADQWRPGDTSTPPAVAALFASMATGDQQPLAAIAQIMGVEPLRSSLLTLAHWCDDLPRQLAILDAFDAGPVGFATWSWQKQLDQAMLRTDWTPTAASVFFACRSPVNNGHAHIDPAGFDMTALGRPLVVDPGRFTYRNDADRRAFKSATWHNCLTVNDREPFAYLDAWYYGPQQPGRIVNVSRATGLQYAVAEHHNYQPALHRRAIALLDQGAVVVMDDVTGLQPDDTVQLYYHLDMTDVTVEQPAIIATGPAVALAVLVSPALAVEVLEGRVSDYLDVARPSRRLRFMDAADHALRRRYVTLLLPFDAHDDMPNCTTPIITDDDEGWFCQFTIAGDRCRIRWIGDELALAQKL